MGAGSVPGLPDDYACAMLAAEETNRARVTAVVADAADSPELTEHVAALRLYLRVPHFLTEWISDPPLRGRVSAALALDVVAMKLLDDLMDDDSGLDRVELACTALHLHLTGLRELCRECADAREVVEVLHRDFTVVCAGQIRTKRHRAGDLQQWRAHAHSYGTTFLGCYGTLAALCGGRPESAGPARSFAEAFGTIITVADDLRDYERDGERAGNLGHLVRTEAVAAEEVADLLEELRARALGAVREQPVARGLVPVVDLYTDDVFRRLLP